MELHLKIIGVILTLLSMVHVGFPRRFNWNEELKPLSLINRQMMVVHTFFIGLMVLLNGLLCFFYAPELINSELGRILCFGLGIFWGCRLVFQFFVYSSQLWKGKRFETIMHIIFSMLWLYLTVVFFVTFFNN